MQILSELFRTNLYDRQIHKFVLLFANPSYYFANTSYHFANSSYCDWCELYARESVVFNYMYMVDLVP